MNYDKAVESINKYFDEIKSNEILEEIKKFTHIYINLNECPYLGDDIFNSKLNELLFFFEKSDFLIDGINEENILISNLCNMKPHELNPERYQTIIDKKTYEMKKKKQKWKRNWMKKEKSQRKIEKKLKNCWMQFMQKVK